MSLSVFIAMKAFYCCPEAQKRVVRGQSNTVGAEDIVAGARLAQIMSSVVCRTYC